MSGRRARGDGGLHWDERHQRWIATATTGYEGRGKRQVKRASGRTKTEARDKLRAIMRDVSDGMSVAGSGVTVEWVVQDWLTFGLVKRSPRTVGLNRHLCETYVIPALGALKIRALTPAQVDSWLQLLSVDLSKRTIQIARACLRGTNSSKVSVTFVQTVAGGWELKWGTHAKPVVVLERVL